MFQKNKLTFFIIVGFLLSFFMAEVVWGSNCKLEIRNNNGVVVEETISIPEYMESNPKIAGSDCPIDLVCLQTCGEFCYGNGSKGACQCVCKPSGTVGTLPQLVDRISKYAFPIFVALPALFLVIAAMMFLFARGDAEKTKMARHVAVWASIGLAFFLLSKALADIIMSIITGE